MPRETGGAVRAPRLRREHAAAHPEPPEWPGRPTQEGRGASCATAIRVPGTACARSVEEERGNSGFRLEPVLISNGRSRFTQREDPNLCDLGIPIKSPSEFLVRESGIPECWLSRNSLA